MPGIKNVELLPPLRAMVKHTAFDLVRRRMIESGDCVVSVLNFTQQDAPKVKTNTAEILLVQTQKKREFPKQLFADRFGMKGGVGAIWSDKVFDPGVKLNVAVVQKSEGIEVSYWHGVVWKTSPDKIDYDQSLVTPRYADQVFYASRGADVFGAVLLLVGRALNRFANDRDIYDLMEMFDSRAHLVAETK